jgi:hypothetical protein
VAYFTLQFQAFGPQVDAYVAVSLPREEARDVLGDCLFVYDGKHKIFSLAF